MMKRCYACRNEVDWLVTRCQYCTSELDSEGNDPRPQPTGRPSADFDAGIFLKCLIVVALCMWLIGSCTDRYWCKPEHRGSQNEKWVTENCK